MPCTVGHVQARIMFYVAILANARESPIKQDTVRGDLFVYFIVYRNVRV